jgi:hypothetical protein
MLTYYDLIVGGADQSPFLGEDNPEVVRAWIEKENFSDVGGNSFLIAKFVDGKILLVRTLPLFVVYVVQEVAL